MNYFNNFPDRAAFAKLSSDVDPLPAPPLEEQKEWALAHPQEFKERIAKCRARIQERPDLVERPLNWKKQLCVYVATNRPCPDEKSKKCLFAHNLSFLFARRGPDYKSLVCPSYDGQCSLGLSCHSIHTGDLYLDPDGEVNILDYRPSPRRQVVVNPMEPSSPRQGEEEPEISLFEGIEDEGGR